MPFKSLKQQKYLFAKKPKLAKKWAKKYGAFKKPKGRIKSSIHRGKKYGKNKKNR